MPQLNAVIAIEKGIKSRGHATKTKVYRILKDQKTSFEGMTKTYTPKDDEGERFPPQSQRVQNRVGDLLTELATTMSEMLDVEHRKDVGNMSAVADIKVGSTTLVVGAPVTFLLHLEGQLKDLRAELENVPTLSPSLSWEWVENQGLWRSPPVETTKTKKVPRVITLAPATGRHPAQAQVVPEDVVVGSWMQENFSGAISTPEKKDILGRLNQLQDAVKQAREAANSTEAPPPCNVGQALFAYLLPSQR